MFKSLLITLATASAIELTPDNWESQTADKVVFLKMYAPWCGHCKAMKPDWDSLMEEYESSENILIADVDCIGDGKPLCDNAGVKGFPTIKWGDPANLSPYEGGRDMASLKEFASSLKPPCNVNSFENCDANEIAIINTLQSSTLLELTASIEEYEQALGSIGTTFEKDLQKLQESYTELVQVKDKKTDELKSSSNIAILKSLKKTKESADNLEL